LEKPGISNYLRPVDGGYLIGLGRNVDDTGDTTLTEVSLFDVRDPAEPKRVDVYTFADHAITLANYDFHAFSYFADEHILALPTFAQENSLVLLKVDPVDGFTKLGAIDHEEAVQRSLRIGGYIFSVGQDAIRVRELEDPTEVVADLDLS
jgi:uncharacterized secreted protein with C-terminal beta-propeller domain